MRWRSERGDMGIGAMALISGLVALLAGGIAWYVEFASPSEAPSSADCVSSWNGPDNQGTRAAIRGDDHRGAFVHGSLAQEEYGYCHVTLVDANDAWTEYQKLEFGRVEGAPADFRYNRSGSDWVSDNPDAGVEPVLDTSLNASVLPDGTLELRRGAEE